MTNHEKIQNMNVNEMADLLYVTDCSDCAAENFCSSFNGTCFQVMKRWLESEVEE